MWVEEIDLLVAWARDPLAVRDFLYSENPLKIMFFGAKIDFLLNERRKMTLIFYLWRRLFNGGER